MKRDANYRRLDNETATDEYLPLATILALCEHFNANKPLPRRIGEWRRQNAARAGYNRRRRLKPIQK